LLSIPLAGGLGNQLFQIAAAIEYSESSIIKINNSLLRPRTSENGIYEYANVSWPSSIEFIEDESSSRITSSLLGWALRNSGSHAIIFKKKVIRVVIGVSLKVISRFSHLCYGNPSISLDVGYDSSLKMRSADTFLIGYFQTYLTVKSQKFSTVLDTLKPLDESNELKSLKINSHNKSILVVHIRLGDYKNEPAIGILSKIYYSKAIDFHLERTKYEEIWFFSDEPDLAKTLVPVVPNLEIRWINDINNSAVETLFAMSLGTGFVLSNSTFSCWAAFLSKTRSPLVTVPEPWFIDQRAPKNLLPPEWTRIPR
jgi:Glycosyl transferase family 11